MRSRSRRPRASGCLRSGTRGSASASRGSADPSAQLLYPTTWLGAVLAPWTLYTLYAIGHLALAGAGMTRLARASGLRRTESLVAGAAFLLSGPFVSLVNLWHHLAGAAWLPWVVLAVHRLVRRPRPGAAIRLGVCLALQVLAGSADMVLMTAALSLAWVVGVARPATRRRADRRRGRGRDPAGPAAVRRSMASRGRRRVPRDPARAAHRAGRPLVRAPGRSRASRAASGRERPTVWTPRTHLRLFDSTAEPLLGSLYLGIVPLALAGAGLAGSRRRALTWALAAAAVAATLVAFGSHAPFAALVRAVVPGASHLRYPSKAMLIPAFACALLAGQGLAAHEGSLARVRRRASSRFAEPRHSPPGR